jgi:hypothetical protein
MNSNIKINGYILYFFAIITFISFILMYIKSFYIINECILVHKTNIISYFLNTFLDKDIIDSTKCLKFSMFQNFKTNKEFEYILDRINPLEYNNLIEYYKLDYFFMLGYGILILLLLYNIKYELINQLGNKLWIHKLNFFLVILFIILGVGLDALENYQLIYQVKNFTPELIENYFYPYRYEVKNFIITIIIIYIILLQIFLFIKSKISNCFIKRTT